jgi:hypothetical protein
MLSRSMTSHFLRTRLIEIISVLRTPGVHFAARASEIDSLRADVFSPYAFKPLTPADSDPRAGSTPSPSAICPHLEDAAGALLSGNREAAMDHLLSALLALDECEAAA